MHVDLDLVNSKVSGLPWDADVLQSQVEIKVSPSAIRQGGESDVVQLVTFDCSMKKENASKTCYRGSNDVAEAVQTAVKAAKNVKRREACSFEGIDQRQI